MIDSKTEYEMMIWPPLPGTPPPRSRWITPAIWTVAFVLCVWTVQRSGAPLLDILRYAVYFGAGVTVPGVLILRATTRGSRSYAEQVGLGSAVGLAWELAGWAIWTGLGLPRMQIAWALVVPVAFLAVPRLRRHWRVGSAGTDAPRLPVLWSAGLALVCTGAVAFWYAASVHVTTTPPNGQTYYPDLLWHLALVQEAGRHVPPQVPQVAGDTMRYHWFADAHLASAAHVSGLDPRLIVFRLWFAPMLVATVLCIAALARQAARTWWTGPLAAAVSVVLTRVALWDYATSITVMPAYFLSPSQTYGSLLCIAVAALLLGVLFGSAENRQPRRAWIPVGMLVAASAGAKPTTIPLLLAGTGLAALAVLIQKRRLHRPSLLLGAGLVGLVLLASVSVTGSTAGTAIRLLGALRVLPGYAAVTGDTSYPSPDSGSVIPGLQHADGKVIWWTVVTLVSLLVAISTCVVPLLVLARRRLRSDPAVWWLLGALTGGWLGFLLIDHPGAAEYYFLGSAVPFGAVLTVTLAATGLDDKPRTVRRTLVLVCAATAIVVAAVIRLFGNVGSQPPLTDGDAVIAAVLRPLIWFGGAILLGLIAWFVLRRRSPALRGLGICAAAIVVLGLAIAGRTPYDWGNALAMDVAPGPELARPPFSAAENEAADWVEHNVPQDDVVATNTLCLLPRLPGKCDARGYLVSGIGGRRAYIEGWAYTGESMRNQQSGLRYTELPSPWPDRVQLTYRAIARPSEQTLSDLSAQGVGWLFVDNRLSKPDTENLIRYADQRFDNGQVQIYRLR